MQVGWRTWFSEKMRTIVLDIGRVRFRFCIQHTQQCVLHVRVKAHALVHQFIMRARSNDLGERARNGLRVAGS